MLYSHHNKKMSDKPPKGLEILQASYGAQGATEDVTKQTQKLVQNGELHFTVGAQAFGILDPAPGVKKTFQANVSINGGSPTLFIKDDGEQIVINAPTVKSPEPIKSPGGQVLSVIWYILVALVGTFFICCSYYFGTYGMGSPIVGIIIAMFVTVTTVAFGVGNSAAGPFGLLFFILAVASIQLTTVFIVSVISPNYIDFSWAKKVAEPVVQAVQQIPE
jgi:hypothetical protein